VPGLAGVRQRRRLAAHAVRAPASEPGVFFVHGQAGVVLPDRQQTRGLSALSQKVAAAAAAAAAVATTTAAVVVGCRRRLLLLLLLLLIPTNYYQLLLNARDIKTQQTSKLHQTSTDQQAPRKRHQDIKTQQTKKTHQTNKLLSYYCVNN
jgi:hypothetical protein